MLASLALRVAEGASANGGRIEACGAPSEQGFVCKLVYDATGNVGFTKVVDRFAIALNIIGILLIAFIATRIVHLIVKLVVRRMARPKSTGALDRVPGISAVAVVLHGQTSVDARAQRARTLGAVARSVIDVGIWAIAAIYIFEQLGIALGPFIAGAGIIGVALGFGAQSLVRDFLSGVFMLAENQFGVGDIIDTGFAIGVVEYVTVRSTVLRDADGVVWYVPNGKIERLANRSSAWERVLLDVEVDRTADTRAAIDAVNDAIAAFATDEEWAARLHGEPVVTDVVDRADNTLIQVMVRTDQLEKWAVTRDVQNRIRAALGAIGIGVLEAASADVDEPRSLIVHTDPDD